MYIQGFRKTRNGGQMGHLGLTHQSASQNCAGRKIILLFIISTTEDESCPENLLHELCFNNIATKISVSNKKAFLFLFLVLPDQSQGVFSKINKGINKLKYR